MQLSDPICDYVNYIRCEKGYSPRTVETYQSRLRHFQHWVEANGYPNPDLSVFSIPVIRRYLYAQSALKLRPRTIRGMLHPLRGMGNFLVEIGAIGENPALKVAMPKRDAPDRKFASDEDLQLLMQAVERTGDPHKLAFRRAILSVLINCGPRAQELLDLKVGDFSPKDRKLVVAHGKGEKRRTLHPPAECMDALCEWLAHREKMGCVHDWLWGVDRSRRISYGGLCRLLAEVKCLADMRDNDSIHCHSIRRAFATRLHRNGGTITACQAVLGHAHSQTTFLYLGLDEGDGKVMAELAALGSHTGTTNQPKPTSDHSPANEVVKLSNKAAFQTSRRRTASRV